LRLFSSRYADVRRNPHSAALQAFENELKADLQAVAQREQLEQARPDSVLSTGFLSTHLLLAGASCCRARGGAATRARVRSVLPTE
jgi:hypothetical protein